MKFISGAMRHCYRMKELTPPQSISNHRFHDCGWSRASNYIAKTYFDKDGRLDTSDGAKLSVQNDIMLQYEGKTKIAFNVKNNTLINAYKQSLALVDSFQCM